MGTTKNEWRTAALQIASGGTAGFIETCIMNPLDLVKTRLQLQVKASTTSSPTVLYSGTFDCMKKMILTEGIGSLYKGILPILLVETPKVAVRFLAFEQSKKYLLFGSDSPTPLTYSLAGLVAGTTEGILINPFEMVKVTLQANRAKMIEAPNTWAVTRQIIKESGFGLSGLNRGLGATVARNGIWNCIYFGFYHSVKNIVPESKDSILEFLRKFTIGLIGGTIGSVINIPTDVAKSRMQGPQPVAGVIKYKSTIGTIVIVAREEGVAALYKGITPKILRLGPGGAILLVLYDYAHSFYTKHF